MFATPVDGGGATTGLTGSTGQHDSFTFLGSEDTVWVFSPDDIEKAARNTYQADASGVVYAVTFIQPQLIDAASFGDVAGEYAWIWNQNALVPGVADIAVVQNVKPLGGLEDLATVAVISSSGRSDTTIDIDQNNVEPNLFAAKVAAARARLDAIEGAT
jgi:hypothetical protein